MSCGVSQLEMKAKILGRNILWCKNLILNFLASPVRPKINCGNVGTRPVGRIINDCNGKHTSHENEEDTMKFLISS